MKYFSQIALFVLLLVGAPLFANQVELSKEQEKAAESLFQAVTSPFCPGRLLRDCPSSGASELKNRIRQKVKEGNSEEEILEYIYTLYGEDIRAVPKSSGFGLVGWLTPVAFLLIGALFILVWLSRKKVSVPSEAPAPKELDSATQARIEAELNKL